MFPSLLLAHAGLNIRRLSNSGSSGTCRSIVHDEHSPTSSIEGFNARQGRFREPDYVSMCFAAWGKAPEESQRSDFGKVLDFNLS